MIAAVKIKCKDNCRYHCKIIPAIKESNNLMNGYFLSIKGEAEVMDKFNTMI